jgi:hypothetical protein
MFEKSPDQLASLKVQMMDKTAYCTQRHIILLDDTAKNLKEGMSIYDPHLWQGKSGADRLSRKLGVQHKSGLSLFQPDVSLVPSMAPFC